MSEWTEIEKKLRSLLRGQHSSLTVNFNDHACNYCTVCEAVERGMYDHANWVSETEKERAIEDDTAWTVHWYPDTPVGFYCVAASSLQAVMEHVEKGGFDD